MNDDDGQDSSVFVIDRPETIGTGNVLIGLGAASTHNHCVIIGRNVTSDHDNQLKIGNTAVSLSRTMTDDEYAEIRDTFKSLFSVFPGAASSAA